MLIIFFAVSLTLWFSGYFSMKGLIKENTTLAKPIKLIFPPKWLYYLCGAPRSTKYPVGMMTLNAFRAQIAGIIFAVYTCSLILIPSKNLFLYGLYASAILPYLIAYLVDKLYKTNG